MQKVTVNSIGYSIALKPQKPFQTGPTIKWSDILASARALPDNHNLALYWIRRIIGYLPEAHIYMPSLSFVQVLAGNYHKDIISTKEFVSEIIFHTKRMRNEDMKRNGFLNRRTHSEADYQFYSSFLSEHAVSSRVRHCRFLGYEPDLTYSMEAELYLRQYIQPNSPIVDDNYKDADFKAATITEYRKAFFTVGETIADESDLIGLSHIS